MWLAFIADTLLITVLVLKVRWKGQKNCGYVELYVGIGTKWKSSNLQIPAPFEADQQRCSAPQSFLSQQYAPDVCRFQPIWLVVVFLCVLYSRSMAEVSSSLRADFALLEIRCVSRLLSFLKEYRNRAFGRRFVIYRPCTMRNLSFWGWFAIISVLADFEGKIYTFFADEGPS